MVLRNQLRSLDFHQNVSPKWPVWKDFSINTPNLQICTKLYAMAKSLCQLKIQFEVKESATTEFWIWQSNLTLFVQCEEQASEQVY